MPDLRLAPRSLPTPLTAKLIWFAIGAAAMLLVVIAWHSLFSRPQEHALPPPTQAQDPRFPQTAGADLYRAICQGCHMSDGRGATGAGTYPALAGNPRIEDGSYPTFMVVNGRKAMPGFADKLSDQQIAAVVNYIRTSFGNKYSQAVTVQDVAAARPEHQK